MPPSISPTPEAVNVICLQVAGRHPDTFDLRQRDPEVGCASGVPAVPGLPCADRSLRARAAEFRSHRELSDRGRGRTTDRSRRDVFPHWAAGGRFGHVRPGIVVPGSPLAPRTVTGAQGLASALISTGVFDGCAAQRMVSGAIGSAIYTATPASWGPFAPPATGRSSRSCSTCCRRTSCGRAPEDRNDLVQVRSAVVPARRGRSGAPDGSAVALDRGAGGRRGGASAASGHSASVGHESWPDELGAERERDDDQLHPAARERAVHAASEVHGHDRRPEPRPRRWRNEPHQRPEHGRGGHGCVDDGRSDHRAWWASRITVPAVLPSTSCFCRNRRCWAVPASRARRLSVPCNWPPIFGRTGTRFPRACCRTWRPSPGSPTRRAPASRSTRRRHRSTCTVASSGRRCPAAQRRRACSRSQRGQLHEARSGAFEVPGSGQRKGQAGRLRGRHHPARGEPARQVREHRWRLRDACRPFQLSLYQHRQAGCGERLYRFLRRRLLRERAAHQPSSCGSRSDAAQIDQGCLRLRSGPSRDVHVGTRDELGAVPEYVPGSHDGRQHGVGASPPLRPARSQHGDAGLAEPDRPVLLGGDVDRPAGVRDDAGHRRQHADRQHHHPVRDRGGARMGFESAERAGHRVRWKEHPVERWNVLEGSGRNVAGAERGHRKPAVQRFVVGPGADVRRVSDQLGRQQRSTQGHCRGSSRQGNQPITGSESSVEATTLTIRSST